MGGGGEGHGVPRATLASTSPVVAMRARLVELRKSGVSEAAVYGTKADLWERLVKCEGILDEQVRQRGALEERQRRLQEGVDPVHPTTLKMPERPDDETVRAHELTHSKFEAWCLHCVLGKGAGAKHSTQHITDKPAPIPIVQVDYHYLKDGGGEATGEADRFVTTVAAVDCDSVCPSSSHWRRRAQATSSTQLLPWRRSSLALVTRRCASGRTVSPQCWRWCRQSRRAG